MQWDREVDVLIIGAGAGGMAAGLVAACEGLEVLICEKTDQVGGTTATAGGTAWVPGNSLSKTTRHPDSLEAARTYLAAEISPQSSPLREAFLESGAAAIDYFERNSEVKFKVNDPYPDYHAEQPGGAMGGRALSPLPFDGRLLGKDFAILRAPIPELMVLGGMMVPRHEIKHFIRPWRSLRSFALASSRILRHAGDRLRFHRGTLLVLGNALAARLFYSCRQRNIPIALQAPLIELIRSGFRVEGAVIGFEGQRETVRARVAVILATGGCGASRVWRDRLTGRAIPHTHVLDGATGDGLDAGIAVGGYVENEGPNAFWWAPGSVIRWPDGRVATFPHIRDRPKPGLIAVNSVGLRFVNESDSYHDFVSAMLRGTSHAGPVSAWLVCDRTFIYNYGLGVVHPVWQRLSYFVKAGYLIEAPTIAALAAKIGVDPRNLANEIDRHNRGATVGVDEAFGKGSKAFNRHNGDHEYKGPNPCLRPIADAPFFAVAVHPAPLGSSAGLRTDANARVLERSGAVIPGLYACGNDMCSVMQGNYPGPGSTLGPAIVFAYRAAMHAVASARQTAKEAVAA